MVVKNYEKDIEEEVEALKRAGETIPGLYRCPFCDLLHRESEKGIFKCHPKQIEEFQRRKDLHRNYS